MGYEKGHPKYGGRQKGTPNKEVGPLKAKAEELGVDPFEVLLLFAKGDFKTLGYEEKIGIYTKSGEYHAILSISPELRQKAAAEACQYLHPKLKAIEHSGELTVTTLENLVGATVGRKDDGTK